MVGLSSMPRSEYAVGYGCLSCLNDRQVLVSYSPSTSMTDARPKETDDRHRKCREDCGRNTQDHEEVRLVLVWTHLLILS